MSHIREAGDSAARPGGGGLDGSQIKLIAIAAMTLDHLTWALFPGTDRSFHVLLLHVIGRLTAPIMWFFIAEGCYYTKNIWKYALRLFVFALISHFAYTFAFGIPPIPFTTGLFNQTSVLWPLFLSVVLIGIVREEKVKEPVKWISVFAFCILAFPADWSSIAVVAPLFLYLNRGNFNRQMAFLVLWALVYAAVYFLFLDKVYGLLQMGVVLSIPVLRAYNGERGSFGGMKWLFYVYYPLHLILIGILRILLHGDISLIF